MEDIQLAHISEVGRLIARTIDFAQSEVCMRTTIAAGIDRELDELKRNYQGIDAFLLEIADELVRSVPQWARQHVQKCLFLPQLGFLAAVALDPGTGKGAYEGEGLGDGLWEKMFTADGRVCYKTPRMRELDFSFKDPYSRMVGKPFLALLGVQSNSGVDKEIDIIHDLAIKLLKYETTLTDASDVCGELDSMVALALGAAKYNWTAPKITNDTSLEIHGGRHPLQQLTVPSFVPNDCEVFGGSGLETANTGVDADSDPGRHGVQKVHTLVLTGPNHSGKTVYLKQVALIVYLAHIGSFVPAESATVSLTDKILTRISTRESVSQTESAFAIDLRQAAFAVKSATRRSLVLVDEFGKGTRPDDGAGLMTAFLDHFQSLGRERPKVLTATHFHEIFENDCIDAGGAMSFAHMDVQMDLGQQEVGDRTTYLYRLTAGRNTSSFGSQCAAMNGLDNAVVERSEAILLLLARNEDLGAACAELTAEEEAMLETSEAVARGFLALSTQDLESASLSRVGSRSAPGAWRQAVRNVLTKGEFVSSSSGSSSSQGLNF